MTSKCSVVYACRCYGYDSNIYLGVLGAGDAPGRARQLCGDVRPKRVELRSEFARPRVGTSMPYEGKVEDGTFAAKAAESSVRTWPSAPASGNKTSG
jgi:hypothetical protein